MAYNFEYLDCKHVTPTDGDVFTDAAGNKMVARGLLIGTNGRIALRMASGRVVKFPASTLNTGVIHKIEFTEVRYNDTDASDIYAFFDKKAL